MRQAEPARVRNWRQAPPVPAIRQLERRTATEESPMPETVSDHVVQVLSEWGVDTVFGLPGPSSRGLVEPFRNASHQIRYVPLRHERPAALAACSHPKFTGRLRVCFSTAAPGPAHLLNALYDPQPDTAPVLAITGMTSHG